MLVGNSQTIKLSGYKKIGNADTIEESREIMERHVGSYIKYSKEAVKLNSEFRTSYFSSKYPVYYNDPCVDQRSGVLQYKKPKKANERPYFRFANVARSSI